MGSHNSKLSRNAGALPRHRASVQKDTEHKTNGRIPHDASPSPAKPLVSKAFATPNPSPTAIVTLGNVSRKDDKCEADTPCSAPTNVHQDERERKLPATVVIANLVLDAAAENLKKRIPTEILDISNFDIKASADIGSLAEDIGITLVTMMDIRQVQKSKQTRVQGMVTEWAKRTLPFLEVGLTAVNVCAQNFRRSKH
jgi:hypothetical protein